MKAPEVTITHINPAALRKLAEGLVLMAEGLEAGEISHESGGMMLTRSDNGFAIKADLLLSYTTKGKAHARRSARRTKPAR